MASKPATTVTLKHLAASIAEDNELSKKQAEAILGGLVGQIVKHLKKGERIRIGGLGILQVRKRAARKNAQRGKKPGQKSHDVSPRSKERSTTGDHRQRGESFTPAPANQRSEWPKPPGD